MAEAGGTKENGKDIVCFQIVVVGKDFFSRHARTEKFKDGLTNARFAMTISLHLGILPVMSFKVPLQKVSSVANLRNLYPLF